ncbi:hypothetical protein PHMEG_00012180 [Phytophthora megakarya]|uniref:Uncharacterized protein n=1 Tax=Phytophthora megakarya TaxID=4795 RepID=A0A225WBY8_9STRA|nr:hypothetical protein PHMEG_00012180 [Phytophthora megakarya]
MSLLSSGIVHSPQFEATRIKVQQGNVASLSRAENKALRRFATRDVAEQAALTITTTSFVELVKKQRKTALQRNLTITKAMVGTQRLSLQPITLEMMLFLKANDKFWDANSVYDCY